MVDLYLIDEIEEAHGAAQAAFLDKQFDRYLSAFADDLEYQQLNGTVIGKAQLARDTRQYFDRINDYSSRYERKSILMVDNRIVEELIQTAEVSIRVVIFFSKKWTVVREGIYEWLKINNNWKIVKVKIIRESIS